MTYDWDFGVLRGSTGVFTEGLITTLRLTGAVVVTGTAAGIAFAFAHRLAPAWAKPVLLIVMDILRSLPMYVVVLLSAYVLPQVVPALQRSSSFTLAWVGLSAYLAALCADVVRGALLSLPRGAIDAGRALGMTKQQVLLHIELPMALRGTIPTQALLWLGMLKNSSIAAVIGVYELAHVADSIGSKTHRGPEAYVVVAAMFIVLLLPFSWIVRRLENRLSPAHRLAD